MSTDDPFSAPPTAPSTVPPAPPAYVPPYPAYGPPPTKPSGVAATAIVLTGLYAAAAILNAVVAPTTVQRTKDTLANPTKVNIDLTSTLVGLLSSGLAIAAFVFLALWMWRIRGNRTTLGSPPGGPPAVEWWGWFIPLANFVLPALGMRAISRGFVGVVRLLGWWVPFCITFVVTSVTSLGQLAAIDYTTGELAHPGALDATVPLAWISATFLTVSWLFLTTIIRRTTDRHLEV